MALNSGISWTDHTWNVARGCHKVYDKHPVTGEKVSECEFCYMYRESMGGTRHNPEAVIQTSTKSGGAFGLPLRLKEPAKIFVSSLTDFWHKDIDSFRLDALDIIRRTPHLTYQILTKRPQRIADALLKACAMAYKQKNTELAIWLNKWITGNPPVNVWLGVSAGYQHTADKRIPILLDVAAAVRFVSAEPLLERVNLSHHLATGKIQWVIVGGESGNETGDYRYRPCEVSWIDEIVSDCAVSSVACWVKQLGTYQKHILGLKSRHGTDPTEWVRELQVQQFPN